MLKYEKSNAKATTIHMRGIAQGDCARGSPKKIEQGDRTGGPHKGTTEGHCRWAAHKGHLVFDLISESAKE